MSSLLPLPVHTDDLLMQRAEFMALAQQASERTTRMDTYRKEQNAVRDPRLNVQNGSATPDYGNRARRNRTSNKRQRHNIPLPLGKAMTVKHAYRIAGSLPEIVVDQRDESPAERHRSDWMEKIAWAVFRASHGETTISSGAWNGSEVGSAVFEVCMDYKTNLPVFKSVDPIGILEVQGANDPHDFQRLYHAWDVPLASVQMEYRDKAFRGAPIDVTQLAAHHVTGGVEMTRLVQSNDRDKKTRFALSGQGGTVGLWEEYHNYGFVPYVIIPNIGPYEDVWGFADYEFVRALTQYITGLFSREADVLKAVAAGAYQEAGTGVNTETLATIIAEGGVASTKRETSIEPIKPADMPSFSEGHNDRAMDMLKMLGFAPDAAWGLPGSGSGTDRGLQLQPLLEYTAMKQLNWQAGLARLFGYAYQIFEKKQIGSTKISGGIPSRSGRRTPFSFVVGPTDQPLTAPGETGADGYAETVELPTTAKELFDGDYCVRFNWRNRVDPEDPQYVMSELNKFQQGIQSMETSLENLGVQAPEDEMKRIEKEAERFPWINDGRVAMLTAQMRGNAQGRWLELSPPDGGTTRRFVDVNGEPRAMLSAARWTQ